MSVKKAAAIWQEAVAAGAAAYEAATPVPMYVGMAMAVVGPGSSEIDPSKPVYYVSEGVCGFAWLTIRPARGALVQWLKAQGIGYKGSYGGWQVSSYKVGGGRSQSLERALAAAQAAAGVLRSYGIEAYADSRLD